jgi:hypothetical protein
MIRKAHSIRRLGLCVLALTWLGSVRPVTAQSPGSGNPAPAQDSTSPAQNTSPDKKPDKTPASGGASATPAQGKKPKVITNDDINADRALHNDGSAGSASGRHAIPGTGVCDDECADAAREMAGFGPDRDGEWQFALTAARRNLAADTAWPGAYVTLERAVKQYCTFQQQVQMTAVPSGSDYNSQVERAKRQQYVEDMGRVLGQNVENANAQIERMAQGADESDPARAAIMRVLAQRVNDSCDP